MASTEERSLLQQMFITRNEAALGRGYDICHGISFKGGLKAPIFDFEFEQHENSVLMYLVRREKSGPKEEIVDKVRVDVTASPAQHYERVSGKSSEEYMREISTKLGLKGAYGALGGSFDAVFEDTKKVERAGSFLKMRYYVQLGTIYLPSNFREFVKSDVQKKLDDPRITLEEIFDAYGTHFIKEAVAGGYAECNVVIRSPAGRSAWAA